MSNWQAKREKIKKKRKKKTEDQKRITKNNNKLKKDSIWSFSGTFERL